MPQVSLRKYSELNSLYNEIKQQIWTKIDQTEEQKGRALGKINLFADKIVSEAAQKKK